MLPREMNAVGELEGVWDICQVYASHEKALAWRLKDEGIGYFLPLQEARRDRKRILPSIPGYVFLCNPDRVDVRDRLRRHHRRDVLRFIDVISPTRLVCELDQIHFAIKNRRAITRGQIEPGRMCRVIDGPFMGSRGVMDRECRRGWVFLNVSMVGQGVTLEIDIDQLEPI